MSLSSLLARTDVKRHLTSVIHLPAGFEDCYGDIRVPSQTDLGTLIGTAFDYLMRFCLERLNPMCIRRPWVAETFASAFQEQSRPAPRSGHAKVSEVTRTVAAVVERCRIQQRRYLSSGEVTPELLTAVFEIAQIDHFVRSHSDAICLVESKAAQSELAALYDTIPARYFVAQRECLLNPTFGTGSALVGGADADVLLDQTLIEIKVTTAQQPTAQLFQQLISYVALAEIGGIDGQTVARPIESIGVYSARHGCFRTWPVKDIIPHHDLVQLASWFLIHAKSSEPESRVTKIISESHMSNDPSSQSGHVLNVAPLELVGGPVQVERLRYVDAEWLRELHSRTRETHVVRRDGETVVCVPLNREAASLGGEAEIIDLKDDLYLSASLVRHALLAYLNSIHRTVLHFRPITFLASGDDDDYLAAALPNGVSNPGQLLVSPVFELDVRVITPEDQTAYVALILDGFVSRRILACCADLIRAGVDVRGVYVKRIAETSDQRLAPKLETVGQVASVDGDTLTLVDHRESAPTILANEAYPQSRVEFFNRCVHALFPKHAETMLGRIDKAMVNFRQGQQLLERLSSVREHFKKQKLPLPQGVTCSIGYFLASNPPDVRHPFPKVHRAKSPVYLFDPAANGKACEWPVDAGLTKYGPYSSRGFTPNRPKVCVLCQRAKKGQVEQFLVKFKDGITAGNSGIQPFEKGFLDKYHLGGIDFEFFTAENSTAEAYRKAAHNAIASVGPVGQKWDLCFVQIESRFRNLPAAENPYMVCKSEFLTHQTPVQEFTITTMELAPYSLQYALNNLALACYAKMNGTPWLLKSDQPLLQEMVIGLGSARISDSRLGPGQRVVGITTVFTGDGNYCLSNLSRAASFDTYQEELLSTLRLAVKQVRTDTNWQNKRPVRLVFHAFKPFRDAEITAVKQVMDELNEFNAEFAFVHVVEDPAYRLFDLGQTGKFDKRTGTNKGVLGPNRGLFMLLSEREVLLTLTGFGDVKRPEDGVPRPILLRIHEESTFTDPVYLARQVYAFAGHSWQGFFPCDMPVTIEYSAMIAKLLGHLATLPGWNPSALIGNIGWTRWFL